MSLSAAETILAENLQALAESGQGLACQWLHEAPGLGPINIVAAKNGQNILVIKGQSQASRYEPQEEAAKWLKDHQAQLANLADNPLCLFGFGAPWPALLILQEGQRLIVFEADPKVVLTIFAQHNFSKFLRTGQLSIWSPWHLAEKAIKAPPNLTLLVHPAAKRREPAQLLALENYLAQRGRNLQACRQHPLKIMVIPPLSGGSLSVAISLARAVPKLGHLPHFLTWDENLKALEVQAQQTGAQALKNLFIQTGEQARRDIKLIQPDLVIALAQAPLDLAALLKIKENTDAPLAFWFVEDAHLFSYAAEIAAAYDAFFHIQGQSINRLLQGWGLSQFFYLPLAADSQIFFPHDHVPEEFRAKLSLMGAGYPNRRILLKDLCRDYWPKTGLPPSDFKIFGNGWKESDPCLNAHLFAAGRRLATAECALVYAGTEINLNIHSSHQTQSIFSPDSAFVNPRTFEIAAAAGFQLIDQRPLLPTLFTDKKELIALNDPRELPSAIDYYLAHPAERKAMGQAARQRVLAEHLYEHRLAALLAALGYQR